jgi:hypothetical protein
MKRMVSDGMSVIRLARISGKSPLRIPYANHIEIPKQRMEYIVSDMLFTSLVRMAIIACGKNAKVVQNAARYPIYSICAI